MLHVDAGRYARIVALSTAALAFAAHAATFETAAKVWFPPYGSQHDYTTRARSYGTDLQRFAKENPAQMADVCRALAQQPAADGDAEPILKMFRKTLDMSCIAFASNEKERPAREAADASLRQLMDGARTAVSSIPEAQRERAQSELLARIEQMEPGRERLAAIMRAIALRPRDARGAWYLLRAAPESRAFLENLYRTEADAAGREALNWQAGFAEVLLFLGKIGEARRYESTRKPLDDYERIVDAVLAELADEHDAVPAAIARCTDANVCRGVVWSTAMRAAPMLTAPPPALARIVAMTIPWYASDWPMRMETLRTLSKLSVPLTREALTSIYASREVPEGAMLDAVVVDAAIAAQEKDDLRSIALVDCWLKVIGTAEHPLPTDAWTALAKLEEADPSHAAVRQCFEDAPAGKVVTDDCVTLKLRTRMGFAANAGQWDLARQSVERLLAHVLAEQLAPGVVRLALLDLATSMKQAGRVDDALVIAKYVEQQPHSARATFLLRENGLLGGTENVVFEP